jgi:septum formation topological specificity factor MinE
MLKQLFKPKWQHKNPKVRIQAIEQLFRDSNSSDDLDILTKLIKEDTDASVRLAAFSKLPSIENLLTLYQATPHPTDKPAFSKHIIQHLDAQVKVQSIKEETIRLLKTHGFFETFIQNTTNAALLDQIADFYESSESDQLTLIKNAKHHSIRSKLIGQLESENAIKEAWQWLKSRDKTAAKNCKQRLEVIQNQRKHAQLQQEKAESILQKLIDCQKKHQNTPLAAIIDVNQQSFKQLDHQLISNETINAIQQTINDIQALITKEETEKAQQATDLAINTKNSQALSELDQQLLNIEQTVNQISTPDTQPLTDSLFTIKESLIQRLNDTPIEEDSRGQKILSLEKRIQQYQQAFTLLDQSQEKQGKDLDIEQAIQNIRQLSRLEKDLTDAPILKQQIRDGIHQLKTFVDKCKQEEKSIERHYLENSQKVAEALEDKQLTDAQKQMQIAKRHYKQLSGATKSKYQAEYSRLEKSIQELKQWKRFSTDPVREKLIQDMQALIDNESIAPLDKAKVIKQLQTDWKELGFSEDQNLWDKFQSLAQEAYLPCKEAFDEEKAKRAFNLQQRQIICEEIEGFIEKTNWHLTDYKALDKLLTNILNEWSKYSPIERSEHTKSQERFSQSINFIKEKLQSHKTENLNQLKLLIDNATELLDDTDTEAALKSHQELLSQWKKVGLTFRNEQQKAWQQFKQVGDALYDRKKQQQLTHKKENAQRLQFLIEKQKQMQNLINDANNNVENTTENSADLTQLKTSFNALKNDCLNVKDLPQKEVERLKQKLEKLTDDLNKSLAKVERRQWVSQFSAFDDYLKNLKAQANENQAQLAIAHAMLPEKWQSKVIAASQKFSTPESNAMTIGESLCIELEILTDQETPSHNQKQRIDMQMLSLKNSFGSQTSISNLNKNDRIEELYCEFFGLPQNFLQQNDALVNRFTNSGNAFLNSL